MSSITSTEYEELEELSFEEAALKSQARLPLFIPWHPNEMVPLGSMFFSTKLNSPWGTTSPFDSNVLMDTAMVVTRDYGSQSTFKSQSTSKSTQTKDHLELGIGVGAGIPFLASVSVKGDYCKNIQENTDANKTSVNFSVRAGFVSFERQPRLTTEAIITIKYGGGLPAFCERYGDYYLAGYRLGGDTGILVSGDAQSKSRLEKFGITVTVQVLFFETSVTYSQRSFSSEAHSKIKLIGYDTLGHTTYNSAADGSVARESVVREKAADYCAKAKTLDFRVQETLDRLDIHDGDTVSLKDCRNLVQSGLVVELMLLPVITIRDVQSWVIEDDVI